MSFSRNKDIPALPDAFVGRIREQFPDEHPAFTSALDRPPRTSIRLNPHKWGQIRNRPVPPGEPVPWSLNGRFLKERPSFTHDPLFHAGCYYVQEASSMFLERVLAGPGSVQLTAPDANGPADTVDRQSGDPPASKSTKAPSAILDACASPGGKTTLLASLFPDALIVANEVIRSRVPPLMENSIKWGAGNIVVTQNDPSHFSGLPGFFDIILTDAPCSGEGLFRKDPGARLEWSPENARHCSLRQRSILTGLWPSLRPGGLLIYTTCTFNPEENERNIAWLLEQTGGECVRVDAAGGNEPHFKPESDSRTGTDSTHDASRQWNPVQELAQGPVIGYGFYPHRTPGEGFFLSVIRKPDFMTHDSHSIIDISSNNSIFSHSDDALKYDSVSGDGNRSKSGRSRTRVRKGSRGTPSGTSGRAAAGRQSGGPELLTPEAAILDQTADWFTGDPFTWYRLGERLFRIRSAHFPLLQQLSQVLSVRHAGTEAGRILRNEVIPVAAAAFDIHLNPSAFPVINVSRDDALRFLRRENLPVPAGAPAGWHLVAYEGLPLGWTKNIGRRMNNYYPGEWRIRK
ncbi:MAG: hypothetical protein EA363_04645 [Balneolaceae bacterium]|nr:MAG: hypothetical protein EA363_04645 [Balneolaceae bacterium]